MEAVGDELGEQLVWGGDLWRYEAFGDAGASEVGDVSGNDDGRACFDRGGEVPKIVGVRARQSGCQRFVVGLQNSACGVRGDSVAKYLGFRRR